jgi:hypothetical protein
MQNNLFASLASTLADILGISQYTCYCQILGPQWLIADVFANGRAVVANVLANGQKGQKKEVASVATYR